MIQYADVIFSSAICAICKMWLHALLHAIFGKWFFSISISQRQRQFIKHSTCDRCFQDAMRYMLGQTYACDIHAPVNQSRTILNVALKCLDGVLLKHRWILCQPSTFHRNGLRWIRWMRWNWCWAEHGNNWILKILQNRFNKLNSHGASVAKVNKRRTHWDDIHHMDHHQWAIRDVLYAGSRSCSTWNYYAYSPPHRASSGPFVVPIVPYCQLFDQLLRIYQPNVLNMLNNVAWIHVEW